jgi:transposase
MAPNLAPSQHDLIHDMILDNTLKTREMANIAECSERSIKAIGSNLRCFGNTKAPPNSGGRPRSISTPILKCLCKHLLEKPDLHLEEMVVFLWDKFEVLISTHSISRTLKSIL